MTTETSVTLEQPIEFMGKEYKSISFRQMKARDLFKAQRSKGDDIAKELTLFEDLSEIPRDLFGELLPSDYARCAQIVGDMQRAPADNLRDAILALSTHVGWDISSIEDMTPEEIEDWCKRLPDPESK